MSDFSEVMNAILAEVDTAIDTDTVYLHRGFKAPADIVLTTETPVFCMIYSPAEDSDSLDDAQFDRVVSYQVAIFRAQSYDQTVTGAIFGNPAFDAMATDLDKIRDRLQGSWTPAGRPLGGLVDTIAVAARSVQDHDTAKVLGLLTIVTGELT